MRNPSYGAEREARRNIQAIFLLQFSPEERGGEEPIDCLPLVKEISKSKSLQEQKTISIL